MSDLPGAKCNSPHSVCSWSWWFCTYVKMTIWVMWNVWVFCALISIPLVPVAGDCLSHSSLSPCLLFCLSLSIFLLSASLLRGDVLLKAIQETMFYSLYLILSLPLFLLLLSWHFFRDGNNLYQTERRTMKDVSGLKQLLVPMAVTLIMIKCLRLSSWWDAQLNYHCQLL